MSPLLKCTGTSPCKAIFFIFGKLCQPPTAADCCSASVFTEEMHTSVDIAIDHYATRGFRYLKVTTLSKYLCALGFSGSFFYVSTASSGILYNLWHNAAEIWGCVWAFLPSKSSCNHKLQATNELSHDVKGNCPKKCNVLMEISCTAKYTVSECILNLSGGFFFFIPPFKTNVDIDSKQFYIFIQGLV